VNLDLIFAVPGQTLEEWESDLAVATGLAPDHISAYNLTYEEGTPFDSMRRKGEIGPLPEEIEVAMFTRTREIFAAAGYAPYEISNFARPGRECRHNLNYWQSGEYLGVGAGAHSFAIGRRWSDEKSPVAYLAKVGANGHARAFEEALTAEQSRGEFIFLGLRLASGFEEKRFRDLFGLDFLSAFPHAAALRTDGLLDTVGDHWRLSPRGLLLADTIFATFQ
jgi:oxygen-independent coproporphyrinogen-3 oxidase